MSKEEAAGLGTGLQHLVWGRKGRGFGVTQPQRFHCKQRGETSHSRYSFGLPVIPLNHSDPAVPAGPLRRWFSAFELFGVNLLLRTLRGYRRGNGAGLWAPSDGER